MSMKSKGIAAERELIHILWKHNYAAARVAGSGSSRYPSCDILAGNTIRKFAFECKSIKKGSRYIPKSEMDEFCLFAKTFGAEPWIAVRFAGKKWHFIMPEDMIDTPRSKGISAALIQVKGLLIEELLQ
jgi:holliday junction resolvase Hjr